MKHLLCLIPLLAGCSTYTETQLALIDQSRAGLTIIEQAHAQRAQMIESYQSQQRQTIDDAFDADARAIELADADWIIDARRAYAVALDALASQRAASRESDRITQSNSQAIRQALDQLQQLITLPVRFSTDKN